MASEDSEVAATTDDDALPAYRPISALAVVGLVAGMVSFVAMLHPNLWIVPCLAVLVCGGALARIARSEGELSGRKVALAGLCLAIVFGTAAPVALVSERAWMTREARQVVDPWFEYLASGRPELAHQLTLPPTMRPAAGEDLWNRYRTDQSSRESLQEFVAEKAARTLLALGPKARSRYFETAWIEHKEGTDRVCLIYAVTFDEADERKTFFVNLILVRTPQAATGESLWRIQSYLGGVYPPSLQ